MFICLHSPPLIYCRDSPNPTQSYHMVQNSGPFSHSKARWPSGPRRWTQATSLTRIYLGNDNAGLPAIIPLSQEAWVRIPLLSIFFSLLLLLSPLVGLLFVLLENSVASRIQTLISTAVFRCKYPICSTQSRVPRGSGMGMLSHPTRDQTGVPQTTPFLFILSPSPKRQPQLASRDGPVAAGFARQTPPVGFD